MQKRTEGITIRVTPEEKQMISDAAWEHRMSQTEYLVYLVREQKKRETANK